MNKFTHLMRFVQHLFDEEDTARKAKKIVEGILKARSPRLSDIARGMSGKEEANYRASNDFWRETCHSKPYCGCSKRRPLL